MQHEQQFENIAGKFKGYINTNSELMFLKVSEKVSLAASEVMSIFLIAPIIILCIFFSSIAAAFYISSILDNKYEGFLIVGGAYFVIGALVICFRKTLLANPLRNKIIREIFREK